METRSLSHFEVDEPLAHGGMGIIYKAQDVRLGRTVALKFLSPHLLAHPDARARLLAEARTAARLDHPHICTIYEVGETDTGDVFLAMPLYQGSTVHDLLDQGPLPIDQCRTWLQATAEGLAHAHMRGCIHRDIKPHNLFVTDDGVLKILDFGLSRMDGEQHLTQTGTSLGTPAYMAPEQVRGEVVDAQADLWALGVVAYEMLAGRRPFDAAYPHAAYYAILHETPPPLATVRPDAPVELVHLVEQLMAKSPSERPASAEAVLAALQPSTPAPAHTPASASKPWRASRVGWRWGGVLLLVLIVSALVGKGLVGGSNSAMHLAILPFTAIGHDSTAQVFADGLLETMTSQLSRFETTGADLWVVPASESRTLTNAMEARDKFGATLVVSGSLQRDGTWVRLTLNLIDTRTLRQVASRPIDEPLVELAALQDQIALTLADMLGLPHPDGDSPQSPGGTTEPSAFDFYVQGRGYLQRHEREDNVDTAIGLLERASSVDPRFALAYAALGEAYWRKYRATSDPLWIAEADSASQRALLLDDDAAAVHITLGQIAQERGQTDEAERSLRRALAIDPTNADAYRPLAQVYRQQNRLEEAEALFAKAIRLRPSNWEGYYRLGAFYYQQQQFDQAALQFQRVLDLAPDNISALNAAGAVLYNQGRYSEAKTVFERLARLAPSTNLWRNLGTLYYYEGEYTKAVDMYTRASESSELSYASWGTLGEAYLWSGQRTASRRALRTAITLAEDRLAVNPTDGDALLSLATSHTLLGEDSAARSYLARGTSSEHVSQSDAFRLSYIYELLGERAHALKWAFLAMETPLYQTLLARHPGFVNLRADPRYQRHLRTRPTAR